MRWGQRKARGSRAGSTTTRHKSIKDLPDHELKALVSRLQMEQQLMKLSSPPAKKSKTAAGARFVAKHAGDVLVNVTKSQAQNALNAKFAEALGKQAAKKAKNVQLSFIA